jgi:hypothetical protein
MIWAFMTLNNLFRSQVWEIVANDGLKKCREAIVDGEKRKDAFSGDPLRLFTAAKVMASLVFIRMNVSPWNLNVGTTLTRLSSLIASPEEFKKECYSFPASCVFACLDCLCDLDCVSSTMAHLYSIVTLIFTNLTALVKVQGVDQAVDHLSKLSPAAFLPILLKCFKLNINCSGEPNDYLLFRLSLCAIHAVGSFQAICLQKAVNRIIESGAVEGETDRNESTSASEDLWGSIDDSLLASIDLGSVATPGGSSPKHTRKLLWICFTNALQQSKVSAGIEWHLAVVLLAQHVFLPILAFRTLCDQATKLLW